MESLEPNRNKKIVDANYDRLQHHLDVELARRGLLETIGGMTIVSRERLLHYIEDLEQRADQSQS